MSPVKNANIKRLDTTLGSYSESADSANLSRSISHNILAPSPDRYIYNTEIQDKLMTAIKSSFDKLNKKLQLQLIVPLF